MKEDYVYRKVKSIRFGMFGPQMIKKMAVVKIVTPELYDKEGYPVDGGLMDTRMGVIDPGLRCKTDGAGLRDCPGYFGYIELARPTIHIEFMPLITNFLRYTCRECGKVLIPKSKAEKLRQQLNETEESVGLDRRRKLVKEIITSLKTINKCPHCRSRQQKITLDKPTTFFENDKRLSPIEVRARLERISSEDCELFGVNTDVMRPEWAVLTIFPIPPVTMRPSITLETGERSEDDLTHKLGDIVRINQRLFENINAGAPEIIIEDLWDLLQYHITTYFNNNVAQLPPARHRSGQPLKTLTERIKSKEGRIRYNLAGKRTNFSARTVISPDPLLKLNEVGVPLVIAMKLTVPEKLNEWNMAYMKKFVERGPGDYPGANYVVRPDGRKKRITDETKEQLLEEMQPGYLIERHLMDGDIAIFNRQPSLHRMSMMCHKIKVLPGRTFRLNPSVCRPYNADFDGDEMNLHIPQTEEARVEAELLMEVPTQIISPGYGLSVIGCIHDSISGNYVLTKEGFTLPRKKAIEILIAAGVEDISKLPNKKDVKGKEVFSVLLPDDFSFKGVSRIFKKASDKQDSDALVVIEKGKLISGVMDSASLGGGAGGLLRDLHAKYGAHFAADFIGKVSKLGIQVLLKRGFTTTLADTDLPEDVRSSIHGKLNDAYSEIQSLIESYNRGQLESFPGKTVDETLELKIIEVLNRVRNQTGKAVSEFTNKVSDTIIMAESGARGNMLALAQMAGCVGQQVLRGKRVNKGFTGRTLSSFKKGDLSASAKGFVAHSFKEGMSPPEFFFAAMTGRDSLMDTALRTPKSGYLYRRLANALQDVKVTYDDTVRDASMRIVQFRYGEDGVDVSRSTGGHIDIKKIIQQIVEE